MNRLSPEKIEAVFECFRNSMGIRATARAAGIARNSAAHYLTLFEAQEQTSVVCACGKPRHVGWCKGQQEALTRTDQAKCGCGRPLRHRGWCSVRIARSPSRQALLDRWHNRAPASTVMDALPVVDYKPPPPPEYKGQGAKVKAVAGAAVSAYFRNKRLQRLKLPPVSSQELDRMLVKSGVVIKKCPPGAHAGWKPSWM